MAYPFKSEKENTALSATLPFKPNPSWWHKVRTRLQNWSKESSKQRFPAKPPLFEALEPRVLLSADPLTFGGAHTDLTLLYDDLVSEYQLVDHELDSSNSGYIISALARESSSLLVPLVIEGTAANDIL